MEKRGKAKGLQNVNGVWHMDKVVRGIRIRGSTGTGNLSEAEEVLARHVTEARRIAIEGARPRRRWREAATRYLTDYASKRSIRRDAQALADLDPFIGDLQLDEVHWDSLEPYRITRSHLAEATLIRNLSIVRRITRLASRLWRDKVTNKTWLETAPLLPLGRPKRKRQPYPLAWDEQRLLFSEFAAHLERMSLFKVNTGTRENEVCELRWEWEQKVPGVGSVFVVPDLEVKNGDPRVVVLNDVAQSIVDAQRGRHETHVFCYSPPAATDRQMRIKRRIREQGVDSAAELVYDTSPRPVDRMNNNGWKAARRRAAKRYKEELGKECPDGFRRIRVHDLKHTFGRRLRAAGVSFEDRQDLLGHRSQSVTTHYSSAEIEELKRLANLVNERRESSVMLRVVG